jgi:hypothetical protein
LSAKFLVLRTIQQDIITQIFMQSTRYACQILVKLELSRQIFEKFSNIIFHENPSCSCIRRGPDEERILDVVPGGTGSLAGRAHSQ